MSSSLVYRWFVLGVAIWWMPTRLWCGCGWCDCLAPFVLAAYARAKPCCCLWLVILACVPTLVLYIWCVLAVLRSCLTAIEIKWLLLLLLLPVGSDIADTVCDEVVQNQIVIFTASFNSTGEYTSCQHVCISLHQSMFIFLVRNWLSIALL